MLSREVSRESEAPIVRLSGFYDRFGRSIGLVVYQWKPVFEASEKWGYRLSPGLKYACRGQSCRDGEDYGPGGASMFFESEAERAAYIKKYIASAMKRAAKREGK